MAPLISTETARLAIVGDVPPNSAVPYPVCGGAAYPEYFGDTRPIEAGRECCANPRDFKASEFHSTPPCQCRMADILRPAAYFEVTRAVVASAKVKVVDLVAGLKGADKRCRYKAVEPAGRPLPPETEGNVAGRSRPRLHHSWASAPLDIADSAKAADFEFAFPPSDRAPLFNVDAGGGVGNGAHRHQAFILVAGRRVFAARRRHQYGRTGRKSPTFATSSGVLN